jgi:two-component system sensor kinase FixL
MFGTPREKPCYVVQRRSDEPCENCPVLEILDTEHPQEWEWTDPQGRTYHVWGYPFPDPDGTVAVLQLGVNITERKELEKEVLEISEVERQRIGHDLHDTVGQNLTGAAFLSKVLGESLAAKRASEAAHAAKIEELLNQAIAQTRSVARGLSPVRMDADGLIPAMMELASSIEKVYGIRCTVNYTESVCPTDNVVATHLYRITQEAVNNAMKHGKAKNVHIALLGDDHSSIRLTIRDDGVGLPQDVDETKGIGMRIMRYRAGMIGASLQVQPHPDGGTVVECSLRLLNSRT